METQEVAGIAPSQATSHFPLDAVTADVLFDREVARRDGVRARGNLLTGCRELDESVLLGGFERGCVVGISAEEQEEMGLLIGLQTIAHMLATAGADTCIPRPKAMVITTLAANILLPVLRNVLLAQAVAAREKSTVGCSVDGIVQQYLGAISIARVFDFEGLSEVLGELDATASRAQPALQPQTVPIRDDHKPLKQRSEARSKKPKEIRDSEDEESPSSSSSSPLAPGLASNAAAEPPPSANPHIILVTHMSGLLGSLFTRREKQAAHALVQLLSSRLRYISRAREHGGPLILLLNSTSPSSSTASVDDARPSRRPDKPLDPTLRSLFNPPAVPAARRNKPAFGLVFAQLLDLHLLCTRVPRTRADAESLFGESMPSSLHAVPTTRPGGALPLSAAEARFAWVVEVLLDDMGVWGTGGPGRPRRSREQRWGAVDVVDARLVVDAFAPVERRETAPIRLAAGFGGPRV